MKSKQFYDEIHAKNSLMNSIIRYKNEPILIKDVQAVRENYKIVYSELGTSEYKILFFPNKLIDLNPVPLGMMKKGVKTVYIQRIPSKNYKIGLCSNNIVCRDLGKDSSIIEYHFNIYANAKNLFSCIVGEYDSYDKALHDVTTLKMTSSAFSRRFAINRGALVFKTINAAIGICEKRQPVLFDAYQYLNEILEEDLNGPNN